MDVWSKTLQQATGTGIVTSSNDVLKFRTFRHDRSDVMSSFSKPQHCSCHRKSRETCKINSFQSIICNKEELLSYVDH